MQQPENTREQIHKLKEELDQLIHYINAGSALKKWHEQKYQKKIKEFNRLLAREAK
jgi:hypothetical protein